jgi:alpha-beta hydrolase superfamily lysophospholipase
MEFIHGMWHAGWCWTKYVTFFRSMGFNAHALNLRRHGVQHAGRARLWRPLLGTYVKDVNRAAAKFKRPPILVGHSLGCLLIEITMARIRPPAIVLLAPTRHDIFNRSVKRFRAAHPDEYRRLFWGATMWPPIENSELCREMLFSPALPERELLAYYELMQNESFWVAAELRYGFGPKPAPPCGIPTLVIGGELDRAVLEEDVKAVAAYHGTEAVILPGMAHDLMLDVGREEVAQRILDFLDAQGLAPKVANAPQ